MLMDHYACQAVVPSDDLAAEVAEPDRLLTHLMCLLGCRCGAGSAGCEVHPAPRAARCQTYIRGVSSRITFIEWVNDSRGMDRRRGRTPLRLTPDPPDGYGV